MLLNLLGHRVPYHMNDLPLQNIRAESFLKTLGSKFLDAVLFRTVMLTVIDNIWRT